MLKWHGRFQKGRTLMKVDERYGRLSSLRPTFVTYIKDMLETVRRLTVRLMSVDHGISGFTVQKLNIIKKTSICVNVVCVVGCQ